MKDKLNIIVIELFKELTRLRTNVLNSFCYWAVKDRDYMEIVYKHNFDKFIADNIDDLIRNYSSIENDYLEKDYNEFVMTKIDEYDQNKAYRDREEPHSSPLPHHAAYGSVLRGSADQSSIQTQGNTSPRDVK